MIKDGEKNRILGVWFECGEGVVMAAVCRCDGVVLATGCGHVLIRLCDDAMALRALI